MSRKYVYDDSLGYDLDNIVFMSELYVSKLQDNKYKLKVEDREYFLEALSILIELRNNYYE